MDLARITARGRMTIPKRIREAAGLHASDVIAFEVEGDHLVLHKVALGGDGYLLGLSRDLGEWDSPADEAAWRDL